jgi:hypothetical protein
VALREAEKLAQAMNANVGVCGGGPVGQDGHTAEVRHLRLITAY